MTNLDLVRVRRVVERLLDLGAEERARVMEAECGDDAALRKEVLSLLRAAESSPEFLPPSGGLRAAGELLAGGAALAPGTILGGFRLVARLASGGMGTVWEAEQESPRRRVALKRMRFADSSDEAAERFRREAEILARLRHPNVAQVYAAGVQTLPDGENVPWFAMEFVEDARPVTEFVRERGLGLADRLTLFTHLCDAVQHGHERAVVHRDLKPSNVLVDGEGHLKVIDFGVALEFGAARHTSGPGTEAGRIIGTLQSMSPEQLEGASEGVDTRSDVYALGVLLYELVTDRLPHDLSRASLTEASRELSRRPPRPGALVPRLSPDVDAIVLRALEHDRERRYPSAAEFAEDVRRHLRGEPVLARGPTALDHLRCLARRHRVASLALAAVVVAVLAGTAASLRQARRATAAEELATRRFDEVRGLARSVLFELHDTIEPLLGATEARRALAAAALRYLAALEREAGGDPGLLLEVTESRLRLGEVLGAPGHASLGDREAGAREVRAALASSEVLLRVAPGPESRLARARARCVLSQFERAAGRPAEALELATLALEEASSVVAADPSHLAAARLGAVSRVQRAKALLRIGRPADAREELGRCVTDLSAMRESRPDLVDVLGDLVVAQGELALLELQRARVPHALRLLDDAYACAVLQRESVPASVRATEDLAFVHSWRGRARLEAGDPAAAVADHRRAVLLFRELFDRDPRNSTAREDLAFALEGLAAAQLKDGDAPGARDGYAEAVDLGRRRRTAAPEAFGERLSVASAELGLSEAERVLGGGDGGAAARGRALELLVALRADHPESLEVARKLGSALARAGDDERLAGRHAEALARYGEASVEIERAAAQDREHAWTRRMVMVLWCWRGVTHKAAAELESAAAAVADTRGLHWNEAIRAFEAALEEGRALASAGFLLPADGRAIELVTADLAACRVAVGGR